MGGKGDRKRDDGPGQGEGVCRSSDSGSGGGGCGSGIGSGCCGGGGCGVGGAASVVTTQHRDGYYTGGSRPEESPPFQSCSISPTTIFPPSLILPQVYNT